MVRSKPRRAAAYHHGSLAAELIVQAVVLVEKHGSVEFNLRDLSKACGVSIAAVYRHYASKNALMVAIAVEGFTLLHQALAQAALPPEEGEALGRIGRAYIEFAMAHEGYFRVMFNRALAELPEFKPTAPLRDQTLMTLVQALAATQGGAPAVSSRAACQDPAVLLHWGMVHGLSNLWLDRNLELSASEFRKRLDALFGGTGVKSS